MDFRKILTATSATLLLAACGEVEQHCVDVAGEAAPGSFAASVVDKVYFDFDKSNIRADQQDTVAKQAEWLAAHPDVRANLVGHADERGTAEYNMALGERRSATLEKALGKHGLASSRLAVSSMGKSAPEVPNATTEAEHQMNRRVQTVVEGTMPAEPTS